VAKSKVIQLKILIVLENLFHYYIYDMSEYMEWSPNEDGKFAYNPSSLDAYWETDDHCPYFIYVGSELAGFVLVRRYPSDTSTYDMAQFFVLRKFKGKGVGKKTLALIVKSFPGKWQIRVLTQNVSAFNFWKSAVSNIVGDAYTLSEDIDVDLLMHFIRFEG
jgi:predicted acetyltransferase